jgi:hypothetical protein
MVGFLSNGFHRATLSVVQRWINKHNDDKMAQGYPGTNIPLYLPSLHPGTLGKLGNGHIEMACLTRGIQYLSHQWTSSKQRKSLGSPHSSIRA